MAAPLYFLPGLTRAQLCPQGKLVRSFIVDRGLGDVLADVATADDVAMCDVNAGPNGSNGVIVVALPNDRNRFFETKYVPGAQAWTEANGKLWVGVQTGALPEPEDLERKRTHPGYMVGLGDGNKWEVPVIRRPDDICSRYGLDSTTLPRDFLIGREGQLEQVIQKAYLKTWEETAEICNLFYADEEQSKTITKKDVLWGVRHCLRILSLNYRFGINEQNILRLVNSENWLSVLGCSIDHPRISGLITEFNEAQKKSDGQSAELGANLTPGDEDCSPDIAQAVAT